MKSEKITLYFTQGSSDKVYNAELIVEDDGCQVNFSYGRRGSALTSGTKTATKLPYARAKALYDKIVNEKMGKGYTPSTDGVAYSATVVAPDVTGMLPQLLNPITPEEFTTLFEEWSYIAFQTKHDGERRMIDVPNESTVIAANRRGLRVSLQSHIKTALLRLSERLRQHYTIDCEDMGDHLVIFDLLKLGEDLRGRGFAHRNAKLQELALKAIDVPNPPFKWEPHITVNNLSALIQWVERSRLNNEEGVVLKDPDAPYSVGRPNSGGPARKYKFVETATCIVIDENEGKRSVQLGVVDERGATVFMGNVTIPPNYDIPFPGQFVEIEYLYAYPDGGSLYQPQYKGVRTDKTEADEYSSLKFKR